MRIVIEPEAAAHAPELYQSRVEAESIEGFASVDAEALRFYDDRGYLLVRGGLSAAEVASARQTLHDMCYAEHPGTDDVYYEGLIRKHLGTQRSHEGADGNVSVASLALGDVGTQVPRLDPQVRARYVRKFGGFTKHQPALRAISQKRDMLDAVTTLIGEPVREFQDMAMIKPPRGREKPWHQDHAYFNLPLDTRICGVWIALDRVTPENGCMYLLAGAHKDGPRTHFMRRDWQICDREMLGCDSVCAPMEAGDVLLFDAKLPHGTPVNNSSDYRWAIQLHYVPARVAEVDESVRLNAFGNEGKNVTC